jgi:hypothetical protein
MNIILFCAVAVVVIALVLLAALMLAARLDRRCEEQLNDFLRQRSQPIKRGGIFSGPEIHWPENFAADAPITPPPSR